MLPKKNKIQKNDFKKIFSRGKAIHNNYFVILYLINNEINCPQAGIVISKKVGKSTVRNKIKRIIREFLRRKIKEIDNSIQLIIICKPAITNLEYNTLHKELNKSIDKINNIAGNL